MNILIDICHPAHVHLYRNFILEMKAKGHIVFVAVKDIPSAKELLKLYNIRYIDYGSKSDSIVGKTFKQFYYDWTLLNIAKELDIDVGIGTSITISHISKFSKMISFILDDDDSSVEPLFAKFAHPFADYLVSPDVLSFERNKKNHILYPGYHELSYLHPDRFKPDKSIYSRLGVDENDKFFVLRFNAFKAHHDIGAKGLSYKQKVSLIDLLKSKGKVIITSESKISDEFSQYSFKLSPTEIFNALYYATLFIGDSQTMTNEAAVLGTPSLRYNSFVGRISYLEEQEKKFKLAFGFKLNEFDKMIHKIKELLDNVHLKQEWQEKRNFMLSKKIDTTRFLVELISSFPDYKLYTEKCAEYFAKIR